MLLDFFFPYWYLSGISTRVTGALKRATFPVELLISIWTVRCRFTGRHLPCSFILISALLNLFPSLAIALLALFFFFFFFLSPCLPQVCGYVCAGFGLQQFSSAAQSTHERCSCLQRHHTGTPPPTLARSLTARYILLPQYFTLWSGTWNAFLCHLCFANCPCRITQNGVEHHDYTRRFNQFSIKQYLYK